MPPPWPRRIWRHDGWRTAAPKLNVPGGLPIVLVERDGADFDLDHVVLRLPEHGSALSELEGMGFDRRDGGLAVGDRGLRIVEGAEGEPERPLLNHIALLVGSAAEVQRDADRRGVEVDDVKDAENTLAVFLRGPAGVRIEYVEQKPGFALM
jgi:catechol 2,3-dioxygenase-like lactoylglutathione lyase family enzyme